MSGCATVALLTNIGIIVFARRTMDFNDMVVYAKPGYPFIIRFVRDLR